MEVRALSQMWSRFTRSKNGGKICVRLVRLIAIGDFQELKNVERHLVRFLRRKWLEMHASINGSANYPTAKPLGTAPSPGYPKTCIPFERWFSNHSL